MYRIHYDETNSNGVAVGRCNKQMCVCIKVYMLGIIITEVIEVIKVYLIAIMLYILVL